MATPQAGSDADPGQAQGEALRRRLAFLQLGEHDAQQLRGLAEVFEQFAGEFVDAFYSHLFAFDETARFLRDPALVARLKQAQHHHLAAMLQAHWDADYVQRCHRVGQAHAEAGVEPEVFLGAYNQYVQFCLPRFESAAPGGAATLLPLVKAIFLDIGLTIDAYFSQATQTLRQALDMYWRANVELKQFAQLASHDLKTPLATVANLCDEALDEFGDQMPSGARQLVEAARQRTFRMSTMIDELLASTTTGDAVEANEEFSLDAALAEAVERVRPLLEQKQIRLQLPAHYPRAWGNRVRLREALYNLLSNAAKFIDKQPGAITISVEVRTDVCILCIADNGPGIPPEELERIFVPFRRLPAHRHLPGSGLGLYFTKTMIEHQGGRVWAESQPGQGSRFYVQLRREAP